MSGAASRRSRTGSGSAFIEERLRRTRRHLVAGAPRRRAASPSPHAFIAVLDELRDALVAQGLARVAYGDLQELRWQVETFGFHALSLEVRQHSGVHAAPWSCCARRASSTVAASDAAAAADLPARAAGPGGVARRAPGRGPGHVPGHRARSRPTFGEDACHRYVISFTRGAQDVLDVLRLAAIAGGPRALDVVPLFESADALADCEADRGPAAVRPGLPGAPRADAAAARR